MSLRRGGASGGAARANNARSGHAPQHTGSSGPAKPSYAPLREGRHHAEEQLGQQAAPQVQRFDEDPADTAEDPSPAGGYAGWAEQGGGTNVPAFAGDDAEELRGYGGAVGSDSYAGEVQASHFAVKSTS